jgi:hypothetical protein
VQQLVDLDQRVRLALPRHGADHLHRVDRVSLERLLAPAQLSLEHRAGLAVVDARARIHLLAAERLDAGDRRIRRRHELLRRRDRLDIGLDLTLLLLHPQRQLVGVGATAGEAHADGDEQPCSKSSQRLHDFLPFSFLAAAAARLTSATSAASR